MSKSATSILARLADIAAADVGEAYESPRGSNRGPTLAKFFAADNYEPGPRDEGYPWCAAAVCCWVQEFLADPVAKPMFGQIDRPRTAAAFGLIEWGKRAGCLVFTPRQCAPGAYWPNRGDIVVFEFSHCGIVDAAARVPARNFTAIEGNTDSQGSREGWEVAKRPRVFSEVRAFVRLTPKALPV